jgi:hypothetical protein
MHQKPLMLLVLAAFIFSTLQAQQKDSTTMARQQ